MTRAEFEQQVTSSQGRLYRIARSYLQSEHDSLDAVSEAILKAWQKLGTLRNEQYFNTWMTRILTRECINIMRKQKRMTPVADVPEQAAPPTENESLRYALDALPQKLRIVTVMHYMEGYSVAEVGEILRIPKGTVCSRLHDARLELRGFLKEDIK